MSRPTAPRFSLRPAAWGLKALFRSASTRPIGEEWRKFCHPSRANAAPPASQPAQHLSGSFQLNEAHVRRVLRFGYLAPDIVEAIAEGRQPRCRTVKRLLQGVPCVWAEQRNSLWDQLILAHLMHLNA
jgi:hypothetical protein